MPKHRARPVEPTFHGYRKVRIQLPMRYSEPVSEALWESGTLGVTIDDDETRARPYDPTIPRTGMATVEGTFTRGWGLEHRVLQAVRGALSAARAQSVTPEITWEDVENKDWGEEWKKHWKPLRIGERAWVVPSWERESFTPPENAIPLWVDPGMAFGTGTHETTQLCSQEIERLHEETARMDSVLDVGTGSGILAILAVRLAQEAGKPVPHVVGIDIDPESVRVAKENAELNHTPMELSTTRVEELKGPFDLVVANILLDPLIGMMDTLKRLTAPGGTLVMSGILETQREALEAAATSHGFQVEARRLLGTWACVRCSH
ncbi:MAG: 50S ribosomal protein L11 methyltransferase [Myxococcota bacterium]